MLARVSDFLYLFLWIVLQLLFIISQDTIQWLLMIWNQVNKRLWSCWPSYSSVTDCAQLVKHFQGLKKQPKHIAFLITPEDADGYQLGILQKLKFLLSRRWKQKVGRKFSSETSVDLAALAKLITWAWTANISMVSVYDYNGKIKEIYNDLMFYIQDEMTHNLWAVQKHRSCSTIPRLIFHNVPKGEGNIEKGVNGYTSDAIHILLFSNEDGKSRLIEVAKTICEGNLQRQTQNIDEINDINFSGVHESEVDIQFNSRGISNLKANLSTDPDILIISGNVKSTLGFSPWNIRLSEIFWIPKLPMVEPSHFLKVLDEFAGCQQRFGT